MIVECVGCCDILFVGVIVAPMEDDGTCEGKMVSTDGGGLLGEGEVDGIVA